jgi:uncharacterized membrane protein
MKRGTVIGLLSVTTVALAAGAVGLVWAHQGGRSAVMKRVVSAYIDEALDTAQPTPEQRAAVHAARDRAFAAVEEARQRRGGRIEEALLLFEAEPLDPARLRAFREQAEADHQRVHDAIGQALVEAHGVLTPAQRKVVADYVRAHHPRHQH